MLGNVDRLIVSAATGASALDSERLLLIREHVSGAGFSASRYLVGGRLEGIIWNGQALRRTDEPTAAEVHYLRHSVLRKEWPRGTTLKGYLRSLREVILDPASGLLTSVWHHRVWHLSILRRSGPERGPEGHEWLLVEYEVEAGRWTTAFQLDDGLAFLMADRRRKEQRWLQQPQ
jgi:hypothetical protein